MLVSTFFKLARLRSGSGSLEELFSPAPSLIVSAHFLFCFVQNPVHAGPGAVEAVRLGGPPQAQQRSRRCPAPRGELNMLPVTFVFAY